MHGALDKIAEFVRRFQVTGQNPGVQPPSKPSIIKWKNLLLETVSVHKKYSQNSDEGREEMVCASILPLHPNKNR